MLYLSQRKGRSHPLNELNIYDTGRSYNIFYFGFLSFEKNFKEKSGSANANLN